jgi:hypothetical protein
MEVLTKVRAISTGLVVGRVEPATFRAQQGLGTPAIGSLTRDKGTPDVLGRRLELVTKWLVGLTVTVALLVAAVGWLAIELLMHR